MQAAPNSEMNWLVIRGARQRSSFCYYLWWRRGGITRRGIIISKVTDKLLLEAELLNSIPAPGHVSHNYGELSGYKINSKHRPCSWQALYCSRCLSINRNLTVPRWHFIIWSRRIVLNTSHLYRLIYSHLLSNIHHNLIYVGKTSPFPWWNGCVPLTRTGFICIYITTVLVAIHKNTFILSKCKMMILLPLFKKNTWPGIKHNSIALWIKEGCSSLLICKAL